MSSSRLISARVTRTSTVKSGDVTLSVSETGEGQRLIFFNGLGASQVTWKRVIHRLKRPYRVTTFDFRGHGKSATASDYSFNAFLADAGKIMMDVDSSRPVIVAWSMGADLAIWHAATHPNTLAGVFVVDGAVPVPEKLIQDPEELRRSLNKPLLKFAMLLGSLTPYGYKLSTDDFADMTLEVDERRQRLLEAYEKVDCPIAMVLAEKTAGQRSLNAERTNKLWRAGAERLRRNCPAIAVQWLDGTHALPLRNSAEIAKAIDDFCNTLPLVNMSTRGGPA